jgi:hypothetical protein
LEDPNLYKPEEVGAGGKRRIRFEDSMIVNVLKKRKILQENFGELVIICIIFLI